MNIQVIGGKSIWATVFHLVGSGCKWSCGRAQAMSRACSLL